MILEADTDRARVKKKSIVLVTKKNALNPLPHGPDPRALYSIESA